MSALLSEISLVRLIVTGVSLLTPSCVRPRGSRWIFTPVSSLKPVMTSLSGVSWYLSKHWGFQAAFDIHLALVTVLDAFVGALATFDELIPVFLVADHFMAVFGDRIDGGCFHRVELLPNADFLVVANLAVHHFAANELGVQPNLLRDRIVRRELVQAAGDDFHFRVALLVLKAIEFVHHLRDLLLQLELHFMIVLTPAEHRLHWPYRGRFPTYALSNTFRLSERDIDAAQELALRRLGQFRIVHELVGLRAKSRSPVRDLFPEGVVASV